MAERCFEHHGFGAQPVDVAKTADGQTVLAQTSWNWHDAIGCFLTLDQQALTALRAAPPPQDLPDAPTNASRRCFEHHKFGENPVDVAKTPDGQTVLARLSWGYHSTIGCYLSLDNRALAALREASTTDTVTTDVDPSRASQQFTPIAVGKFRSCAIKTDQTIACWGAHYRFDRGRTPPGQFTAIAVGRSHSCAIKTDQTITCWGDYEPGQADAPPGQYIAIAVGDSYSCAIKADQTITCWGWGWNSRIQTDTPSGQYTAIAVGRSHSCAIKTDQTITCWGWNNYRQADAPAGQYTAIAAGDTHSCATKTDHTITCWGHNEQGQADAPAGQYTAIAAGDTHSCATKTDHTIACWGHNMYGQTSVPLSLRNSEEVVLGVQIALEPDPVASTDHSFEVIVEFTHAVSGFDADDITVVNGDVTSLSGSGSEYRATVRASLSGSVVMWVGREAVQDMRGNGNEPSQPLVTKVRQRASTFFDTWDREAVLAGFTAEFYRQEPDHGWTGDLARCIAGTTSQQYRDSIFQRVNWYRQMAGLNPVLENLEFSDFAQHAALIMAAGGGLSHYPESDRTCYTQSGYVGASHSNLHLGGAGTSSIDGYMQDHGPSNIAVGHRRWILNPSAVEFGTGDIPPRSSNALYVVPKSRGGSSNTREERSFVAWPSPGYIPYVVVWGRWSFTLPIADFSLPIADFSNATVAVVNDSGPVETEIIHNRDSAIVWAMDGDNNSWVHIRPLNGDLCYAVTISGVQIGGETQPPYEYATCVTDFYE